MRKRIAVIDRQKCHPHDCGNYLCAKLCPVNRAGADCIYPGEPDQKARIDEMLCTGCGICPQRCPFGAITIINLPETLSKDPVHRYGENMFELYSLPSPMFGQVVGVLGKNGIGKSTAIKIMSDLIKPNLGKWKDPAEFKEVIDYFKGTETQKFMEKMQRHEIIASYKPQQVDLIPKQFAGTVKELLQHVDKDNRLPAVAVQLQLTHFLDNPISTISGGELQRVAIAAAALKNAHLYMFDEPTSYLDIKQRLNVSQFIRSLADDQTAIITIEHDLVILDFMTDMLNIMYGHEGVFGVVSGVKSSREGINAFLDGYLREENIRFRDHPLKFLGSRDRKGGMMQELISWTELSTALGNFTLRAEPGTLYKNEIIGVLGENGIGKTSFIKMLAGLISPREGKINEQVKVAYKPQYLETDAEMLVSEFLPEAVERYTNQLIAPLGIEPLLARQLNQLSGGELQRVSIAKCLSQQAQLFLIDEPSAYLDVEQRLIVSKVIKTIAQERDVTILVVDHDLMFIDTLADRLMVFSGKPAQEGVLQGPFGMEEGMNMFLKELNITLRRDVGSHRPRINKLGSVKDREQREEGRWYYS